MRDGSPVLSRIWTLIARRADLSGSFWSAPATHQRYFCRAKQPVDCADGLSMPMHTEVINAYFEKVLLPLLPHGSVIVLDNASFYQSSSTRQLIETAGCRLLFLPLYSPDFNPTKHLWAALKLDCAKTCSRRPTSILFIANMCKC